MYVQRGKFEYNAEGTFFSPQDGVVYSEQAKDIYGIFALLGLVLTGVIIYRIIKNIQTTTNGTHKNR